MIDWALDEDLARMLADEDYTVSAVDCSWSHANGDEGINVYACQTEGPFRRQAGELLRKQGEYYWFDYGDIPETQNNGDFSGIQAYAIPDSYDEALDELFSLMFQ